MERQSKVEWGRDEREGRWREKRAKEADDLKLVSTHAQIQLHLSCVMSK